MSEKQQGVAGEVEGLGQAMVRYADWILGLGVLGLMVTLVTPIPSIVLDGLLALNITVSLLMLLVTMNVRNAADMSTFPTILLFATLFRLGLNVASTRLILSDGEAGSIISAFGSYVVGGNIAVGMVVFLILIIIQFVVITKGAGRISEVAARFVLDAMPGKQMAIDADLNAGLIDADDARARRAYIAKEAEFYGAMDGSSKFVRGDAIAGLIITSLNLVGGIVIGTGAGLSISEAAGRYSMLTIGDGLVSQIPALLVSTAAAVLTTRASSSSGLGANLIVQIGGRPKATAIAAGMLFAIGMLPGMPAMPFMMLAIVLLMVWRSTRSISDPSELLLETGPELPGMRGTQATGEEPAKPSEAEEALDMLGVDRISLEIGYRLIPLVEDKNGAGILEHVSQLRRRFATKEGIVLPPVRIKDNIRMEPGAYRVLIGGQEVARGTLEPGQFLAMEGGGSGGKLLGQATVDPAFGLPAIWIPEAQRDEAELKGYTVVDPTSVLVTHVSEVLRSSFHEILSRDDVKALVERVKKTAPAVVEELIPDKLTYGDVQRVLCTLLKEDVPIRNMPAILEALADASSQTKDPEALTEMVRQRLGRVLCEINGDDEGVVHAVTLEPSIEARIAAAVGRGGDSSLPPVSPAYLQALVEQISESLTSAARSGKTAVVLVRSNVRRFLGDLVRATLPRVAVLSYNEVVPARSVETLSVVTMEE